MPEVRGDGMSESMGDPFEVFEDITLGTGLAEVSGFDAWFWSQGPGAPEGSLAAEQNHSDQLDQQQRQTAHREGRTR